MKSQYLNMALTVLERVKRPLSPRELVNIARDEGIFPDTFSGKTPHQTMKSKLSVHIRKHGENSPFVRTGPGRFFLRALIAQDQDIYNAKPITPPEPSEHVLVFPTSWLAEYGRFQGIKTTWKKLYATLVRSEVCSHMPRLEAEQSDTHKQVLTYTIVRRGTKVLAFRRGSYNRTAEFLRGSDCVGFGGHVTRDDANLFNYDGLGIIDSAARELMEELRLPEQDRAAVLTANALKLVGVLNDDSSPIGRRHFAFLFSYEASADQLWNEPQRGEKSITQLRWLDSRAPNFSLRTFEYWSQLFLRSQCRRLISDQPSFHIHRKRPLRPPHVLCVVGQIGSGKSEATATLRDEFSYAEINSGRILAELLNIPAIPRTPRLVFQKRAMDFIVRDSSRRNFAAALAQAARTANSDRVLIDGIRHRETLSRLRSALPELPLAVLFVHTQPDVAFRLYSDRSTSPIDIDSFLQIREAPVEQEVGTLMESADAVLYNWLGLPSYKDTVRSLMHDLRIPQE